jgi:tRNA pseudouridine55 synthase
MNQDNEFLKGKVLLIDKPLNWTSFQVVNKIRWEIKQKFGFKKIKVGHAGTLDPLATGLLILCTGKFTKLIDQYQAQEKEYTGNFKLGSTTPSYDLETEVNNRFPTEHISSELVQETKETFIGDLEQLPPIFSALKQNGKKLYELARAGEKVEVKPRKINISEFNVTLKNETDIEFKVKCSKGTYIRSLAHDFGKKLHSGAHLTELRRTKIGEYDVENALSVEEFIKQLKD